MNLSIVGLPPPTPPMTQLLISTFGITFHQASQEQKCALIEVIGFLMRERDRTLGYAILIVIPSVAMPERLCVSGSKLAEVREGLTLIALLYGSLNRDIPPAPLPENYL